jgi:lipopolysaccharide heptosyltransferase I
MASFLIVRLGSLGDLIHTLPAVAAIRRAQPDARIDWLVDASHRAMLDLVPVISEVVTLDGRTVGAWLDVRQRLRARQYDVALDFQGLLKSAALARFSGAVRVIGFDRAGLRERLAARFYTEQVTVGEGRHVVQKNLALARAVGARGQTPEFPLVDVESAALAEVQAESRDPFVLLNPGAAWPNKRWPADRFGQLATAIQSRHQRRSIVLWGPGERDLAAAVVASADGAARIAPATGLRDLVALSRAACLMISGDTGPLHIAAAVATPIVALFGPTTADRNGPWSADDAVVSKYEVCECHYQRACRRTSGWCLGEISVADVIAAVGHRLSAVQRRSSAT